MTIGTGPIRRWCGKLALCALPLLLAGCVQSMFYYPDNVRYETPDVLGMRYEPVQFTSADGTRLSGWFLPAADRKNPKEAKGCAQALYPNVEAYASAIGFDKKFPLQDRLDKVLWAQLLQQDFNLPLTCDEMVDSLLGVQHDLGRHLASTRKAGPDDAPMKAAVFSYIAACTFWFGNGDPQQQLAVTQGAVKGEAMCEAAESEIRWALEQLEGEPSVWASADLIEKLRTRARARKAFVASPATAPAKQPWWKRLIPADSQ